MVVRKGDPDEMGLNPASVDMDTGEVFINPIRWKTLSQSDKEFILAHEEGHYRLQTQSETKADQYAARKMAADSKNTLGRIFNAHNKSLMANFQKKERATAVAKELKNIKMERQITPFSARKLSSFDPVTIAATAAVGLASTLLVSGIQQHNAGWHKGKWSLLTETNGATGALIDDLFRQYIQPMFGRVNASWFEDEKFVKSMWAFYQGGDPAYYVKVWDIIYGALVERGYLVDEGTYRSFASSPMAFVDANKGVMYRLQYLMKSVIVDPIDVKLRTVAYEKSLGQMLKNGDIMAASKAIEGGYKSHDFLNLLRDGYPTKGGSRPTTGGKLNLSSKTLAAGVGKYGKFLMLGAMAFFAYQMMKGGKK